MESIKKTIIIAVGGSGGHLFPAQTLAQELLASDPHLEILFLGHQLSSNPFFKKEKHTFHETNSGAISLRNPWKTMQGIVALCRGVIQSICHIKRYRPSLVIGFGSFHALAPLIAAYCKNVPLVLFESNAVLGKVNRLFSMCAKAIAYQLFPLQQRQNPKFIKTTLPLSPEKIAKISKQEACQYFGLESGAPILLLFAGSQGAETLNPHFIKAAKVLKNRFPDLQLIHFVGRTASIEEVQSTYQELGIRSCVKVFEEKMYLAYCASDIVVCRAGANTITEQFHHLIPSLFIPYPFLKDQHQLHNARFACDNLKMGSILQQKEINADKLAEKIEELFNQQDFFRDHMKKIKQLEKPLPALKDLIFEVLNQS